MTNERAIQLLHRLQDEQFDGIHGDERREALEIAVRALEQNLVQESGGLVQDLVKDCISRKMAIDVIDAIFPVDPMKTEYAQGIACGAALAKTYIKQLPSAQPQWIPCGERLPEKGEYVLAMLENKYTKHMGVMKRVNDYPKGEVWEDDFGYGVCDERVPAWMPLPEPYGGENE